MDSTRADTQASRRRGYRSALRQGQAEATRLVLVEVAGRLFAERGYVATSVDAVAAAANMSRATVFQSVGGKSVLLRAAYDLASAGSDPQAARAREAELAAETDPRRYLVQYAAQVGESCGRLAPLHEAVRAAAGAEDAVRALWDQLQAERRVSSAAVVAALESRAPLKPGLHSLIAADIIWVLSDPGIYGQLVQQRGWSPGDYARWLGESLHAQLLG